MAKLYVLLHTVQYSTVQLNSDLMCQRLNFIHIWKEKIENTCITTLTSSNNINIRL